MNDEKLPAAGWNEAIEACVRELEYCRDHGYVPDVTTIKKLNALRHNAPPDTGAGKSEQPAVLTYTNYRGETSVRSIIPRSVRYGSTEWHPEPQWLLLAYDTEKNADREFALKDFGVPDHGGADAGVGKREALLRLPGDNSLPDFTGCNSVAVLLALGIANILDDPRRPLADRELDAVKHAEVGLKPLLEAALSHQPAPVAANASAEARLRATTSDGFIVETKPSGRITKIIGKVDAHPHTSDCDEHGE